MATNEIFRDADHVSLPVPAGTKSGAALRIGGLNVIAETNRANVSVAPYSADGSPNSAYDFGGGNPDGYASCWLKGAHEVTLDFAVNPGDPVYITSGGTLTGTASGNSLFGHALSTKAAAAGPATVRLAN